MRPLWTGAIGFGLVNIPVKLYSATESSNLDLDMLDKKDHSHIKYMRVNERTGKEVKWENIVKGYMVNNRYVVLEDKDFEKANAVKTKIIQVDDFVDVSQVDTMYFETPYYLAPDKNGTKAYALLREALHKTNKAGIASFVMRNKENLAILLANEEVIMLNRIRFHQEIRSTSGLALPGKSGIKPAELKMAVNLINQHSKKFDIKKYKDTYTTELLKLIKMKAKGKKLATPTMKIVHSKSSDLMEQLKASLSVKRKKAS